MTPVIHVLKHPGCIPKAIPSFACIGKCSSYVQVVKTMFVLKQYLLVRVDSLNINIQCLQVSGSKIWQMERTCNCCQESGEREATVVLICPKAKSEDKKLRKVVINKQF